MSKRNRLVGLLLTLSSIGAVCGPALGQTPTVARVVPAFGPAVGTTS